MPRSRPPSRSPAACRSRPLPPPRCPKQPATKHRPPLPLGVPRRPHHPRSKPGSLIFVFCPRATGFASSFFFRALPVIGSEWPSSQHNVCVCGCGVKLSVRYGSFKPARCLCAEAEVTDIRLRCKTPNDSAHRLARKSHQTFSSPGPCCLELAGAAACVTGDVLPQFAVCPRRPTSSKQETLGGRRPATDLFSH
jgi:hypothetical protein